MKKRSQKTVPEDIDAPQRPDMKGWRVWWLVTEEQTGSSRGALVLSVAAPGTRHVLHRHPNCEQVTYVLSGSGLHLTTEEPVRQQAGDAAHIGPGEWHGFENDTEETTVMMAVYGGAGSPEAAGYELFPPTYEVQGYADDDAKESESVSKRGFGQQGVDSTLPSDRSDVAWLVTSEIVGAENIALGTTSFGPDDRQVLHRHPHADEILLVTDGGGFHFAEDAEETPLSQGEVAYVPAGEWHGFRGNERGGTTAVLVYLGVALPAEAGWEEPENHPRAP